MDKPQIAELLALAAAMDQRTIGRSDVEGWFLVLQHVDFDRARTALAAHYTETTDRRVMPADIVRRLRDVGLPYYAPAVLEPVRPGQVEVNARGRALCDAILVGRKGPLVDGMAKTADEASA